MRLLLFLLAGLALAALIGAWVSRRKQLIAEKQKRLTAANVTNDVRGVGKGGVLKLPAFGRSPPVEVVATARHRYNDEGRVPWYGLEANASGRRLQLEWKMRGRDLFVLAGFEDEDPPFHVLSLDEEQLIEIDERGQGEITWDGVTFRFEASGECDFFEGDGNVQMGFYRWSFASSDRRRFLILEKWAADADFQAAHRWRLEPSEIEVFEAGQVRS